MPTSLSTFPQHIVEHRRKKPLDQFLLAWSIHISRSGRGRRFRGNVEIIKRETLPSAIRRAHQGIRLSMGRSSVGRKDHAAIENRQYALVAFGEVLVPQFKMTAKFFFPILVQIQDQVQFSPHLRSAVMTEIGMNREASSPSRQVIAAAVESKIGDKSIESREDFEKIEKRCGVELIQKMSRCWSEEIRLRVCGFVSLGRTSFRRLIVIAARYWRKFCDNLIKNVRRQKVVNNGVRKRLVGPKFDLIGISERCQFPWIKMERLWPLNNVHRCTPNTRWVTLPHPALPAKSAILGI